MWDDVIGSRAEAANFRIFNLIIKLSLLLLLLLLFRMFVSSRNLFSVGGGGGGGGTIGGIEAEESKDDAIGSRAGGYSLLL